MRKQKGQTPTLSRRRFLKSAAVALPFALGGVTPAFAAPKRKPNILFILIDDMALFRPPDLMWGGVDENKIIDKLKTMGCDYKITYVPNTHGRADGILVAQERII